MNQTITTLQGHRSIRKFSDRQVEPERLNEIIDCARAASSSSFLQCSSIIRVTDRLLRDALAAAAGNQDYVSQAPEFLVFCADFYRHSQIVPEAQLGFVEQLLIASVDTALMAQNAMAAAESLGLGGVFIGGLRNQPEAVSELLELPEQVFALFGLCLGYPAQSPLPKPRLPRELMLFENRYLKGLDRSALADYDETVRRYYRKRSDGRIQMSWSEQLHQTLCKEARPFMADFLHSKGYNQR